jgi:hypothetical protein
MIIIGALAVASAVAVLVLYGVMAGEPQPLKGDPIAVLVSNGGSRVQVLLADCRRFDVTEVRIVASPVHGGVTSSAEDVAWKYKPSDPHQKEFDTASAGANVLESFVPLSQFPKSDVFGVYVFYSAATAPEGFKGRTDLATTFRKDQSATASKSYAALESKIASCPA